MRTDDRQISSSISAMVLPVPLVLVGLLGLLVLAVRLVVKVLSVLPGHEDPTLLS